MKTGALLLALATAVAASAQTPRDDPSRYEKLLLPVYVRGTATANGAQGARWQTLLYLRNESGAAVDAFPLTRDCISSSSCFSQAREYPALTAGQTSIHTRPYVRPFDVGSSGSGPGAFLYVERAGVGELSLQLQVADTFRRPLSLGTRVPIVREADYFTDTMDVLGVPILANTRAALRIYDRESRSGARVMLRIHENAPHWQPVGVGGFIGVPPKLLVEDVLEFQHDDAGDNCGFWEISCPAGYRYKPGAIEITDLLAHYPALAENAAPEFGVRIEIIPLTPGLAFWPMASVTENETSVVTIFTAR